MIEMREESVQGLHKSLLAPEEKKVLQIFSKTFEFLFYEEISALSMKSCFYKKIYLISVCMLIA